ncbi:PEBP-like protein, partial [Agrocybe pediades]
FQPRVQLHVLFPQNTTNTLISVTPGEQLQRNETALAPSYRMAGEAGTDGPFLIVMVDPDAPTPQNRSYSVVRHFMGGNYVVSHGKGSRRHRHQHNLMNVTEAIAPYHGARPSTYIFLIYNQPPDFDKQTLVTPAASRFFFNLSSFASATGLGQPIGGNFMLVGPDASSPIS